MRNLLGGIALLLAIALGWWWFSFKTDISLVGDPDIGTLIDAATPLVADDGTPLPKAFDECIRGVFQTLELPPMKTGDAYKVSFAIDLK